MPAPTNEEQLEEVRAMIAAANASILKLLGKTNQSVSFGDQTYSLADVERLKRVRDEFRAEERTLANTIAGTARRTIKIRFPSC